MTDEMSEACSEEDESKAKRSKTKDLAEMDLEYPDEELP
jgi:hypothetical protein